MGASTLSKASELSLLLARNLGRIWPGPREGPASGRGPCPRRPRGPRAGRCGREEQQDPAVRKLLKAFVDLSGALHTQGDTAQVITDRGAGYTITAKANMPHPLQTPQEAALDRRPLQLDREQRPRPTRPAHRQGRPGAPHGYREGKKTVEVVHRAPPCASSLVHPAYGLLQEAQRGAAAIAYWKRRCSLTCRATSRTPRGTVSP